MSPHYVPPPYGQHLYYEFSFYEPRGNNSAPSLTPALHMPKRRWTCVGRRWGSDDKDGRQRCVYRWITMSYMPGCATRVFETMVRKVNDHRKVTYVHEWECGVSGVIVCIEIEVSKKSSHMRFVSNVLSNLGPTNRWTHQHT